MDFLNFFDGGFFGFVGDSESSEISERREVLCTAFFDKVVGKSLEIGL